MKLIEAMKKIKANKAKITDLQKKIGSVCANLSNETPVYGNDTAAKVAEWAQSCEDLAQECIRLHCAIQATNLATEVTIEISGKPVTKSIAAWVLRRREYAQLDQQTWASIGDRNLREGNIQQSTGVIDVKIVRHYDPLIRDFKLGMYREEPYLIDATLEVINAITDLVGY